MLGRTFLHLPGIGEKKERTLWKQGIRTWEDYLATDRPPGVSNTARKAHRALLQTFLDARAARDLPLLAEAVPSREHWRFYDDHKTQTGFLDIETTGTWRDDAITVVGVLDSADGRFHQLVKGDDLDHDAVADLFARFDLFVTFNGNGFDLPVLRHHYGDAVPDIPHLDLRAPLARLGYKGGLKKIEVALGMARPDAVQGMTGYDAVLQWRAWERRRDRDALEALCAYNKEDVVQMQGLAEFAVDTLWNRYAPLFDAAPRTIPWPAGHRPERVPLEVDDILAAMGRRDPQTHLPQDPVTDAADPAH